MLIQISSPGLHPATILKIALSSSGKNIVQVTVARKAGGMQFCLPNHHSNLNLDFLSSDSCKVLIMAFQEVKNGMEINRAFLCVSFVYQQAALNLGPQLNI
jgi:hypothetical protein